jgi:hypothetical protein
MMVRRYASLLVAVLAGLAVLGLAHAQDKMTLVTRSWNLCDFQTDLDGQWQGSIVAFDGNCYFASSSHGGRTGAMFFKYDPKAEKISVLCKDISAVCGETAPEFNPHGKIHSPVSELDGWLYFGTHASYWGKGRKYNGSHLIGYEMATGKFRDFGILKEGYDNYSGVVASAKGKCVYVYVVWPGEGDLKQPCYLYRVDLPGGEKHQVAELAPGGYGAAIFYLYADNEGNCWLPEPEGVLVKYDRARDKVERIPDAIPVKGKDRSRSEWMFAHGLPGTNTAVVTTSSKIYVFDPAAAGNQLRLVREIGSIHLQSECGWALGGTRVYFIQSGEGRSLHLKYVDVAAQNPEIVDCGSVTDQDGRQPMRLPAIAADARGRVYLTGDWYVKTGDAATTRLQTDRQGKETYPAQNRCERFAAVVLPDAK